MGRVGRWPPGGDSVRTMARRLLDLALPRTVRHPLLRYGVAVLAVAVAVALLFIPRIGPGLASILFFAVLVSAWVGGLGPGLLATALIVLIALAMVVAGPGFSAQRVVGLVLFAIGGGVITALVEALHAARRQAEQGEERYRAFVTQSSEGIWCFEAREPIPTDLDEDGQIQRFYRDTYLAECNDAMARMFGYERADEIVGRGLAEFLDRSDPANDALLRSFVRSGYRLVDAESHEPDREGRTRIFLNNLVGMVEGGRLRRAWGTQRDITERRRAEETSQALAEVGSALTSSLDYAETLQATARMLVPLLADACVIDVLEPDGSYRRLAAAHADPARDHLVQQLRRYPPDPSLPEGVPRVLRSGRPYLVPEIAEEQVEQTARDAGHLEVLRALGPRSCLIVPLQARGRLLGALTLLMAESGRRYSESDLAPALDLARRAAQAVDNARLFREAREAARSAHESLALLDTLMKTAPVGLAFVDRDLRYVHFNDALAAIDGKRPEEVIGRTMWQVVPDLAPQLEPLYREVLRRGEPILGREVQGATAARPGEERCFSVNYYPVRTPDGETLGVGAVVADVTEPRRAERELRAAKEAAEGASRAKDRFLAMLSHELRTPLTPVLATVTAMLDEPETPAEIRPTLDLIRRSIELEARLIDDLLDVSRVVSGKLALDRSPVDVHALLHQTVGICRSELHGKRMRLSLALSAARHHVFADPARLQQVFWNLIKNAVKFSPEGGAIAIRTRNAGDDGTGERLLVEVSDTGIGIEPAALPRIFNPFEQGEDAVTRRFGGLGLGLAIGRSVIEAHGGRLTASSAGRGHGSTFVVELAAERGAPAAAPSVPSAAGAGPLRRGLKILLVEDDPPSQRVMSRLLQQRQHEVTTAGTLATALELGQRQDFDLIISDIGLPDGTGLDLMRQLLSRRPVRGIALSGFGMDEDVRRSREAGFLAHLTKPVNFQALEATIQQVAAAGD
jgi:PAS domain S-box-containing protein